MPKDGIFKQKMTIMKQILILSVSLTLLLPFSVQARGLVPCGGVDEKPCTVTDVFVLVARVTNKLIALAGIYAVYVIIGAGWWMVNTMGDEERLTKYRKQMTQAIVGFVLVLMAYMIMNTAVNLILLNAGENKACKLDLSDPLNYLEIHSNPEKHAKCKL